MSEEHKDFAKIVRAKNGQQVLFYIDFDEEKQENVLHGIAHFRGFQVDQKVEGIPDEHIYEALEKADEEYANEIIMTSANVFAGLMKQDEEDSEKIARDEE